MPLTFKTELQLAQWQHRNPNKIRLISDAEMQRILDTEPDGKSIVAKTRRRSSPTNVAQTQPSDVPVDFSALIERVLAEEYGGAPRTAPEDLEALVDRWVVEEFERMGYPQNVTPAQPVVDRVTKKKQNAAMVKAERIEAGTSVLLGGVFGLMLLVAVPLVFAMVVIGIVTEPLYMIPALAIAFVFRGKKK